MLANTGQLPVIFLSIVRVREARVGCSHLMMRIMMVTMVMMMVMMIVVMMVIMKVMMRSELQPPPSSSLQLSPAPLAPH